MLGQIYYSNHRVLISSYVLSHLQCTSTSRATSPTRKLTRTDSRGSWDWALAFQNLLTELSTGPAAFYQKKEPWSKVIFGWGKVWTDLSPWVSSISRRLRRVRPAPQPNLRCHLTQRPSVRGSLSPPLSVHLLGGLISCMLGKHLEGWHTLLLNFSSYFLLFRRE